MKPVPRAPIHAIHGAPIALVAITSGGDAAITADELGAFRLWPAFDGVAEPVVITGQAPRALAIAHDGDGFAIAILDRAGLVEIQRVSAEGVERSRLTLEGAAIAVVATWRGFVVIGEDRAIELVDLAGAPRARLAPEAGARVESLVARGDRVLALASSVSGGVRGRWIDVEHATWGAETPKLVGLAPTGVVMTPDATRLYGKAVEPPATVVVSLATGVATPIEACTGGPLLGFVDGKTLACLDGTTVAWWQGTQRQPSAAAASGTVDTVAIGGGIVVASYQMQLALVTPAGAQYLGYEAAELSASHFTPGGIVIGRGDAVAHVIDGELRARPEIAMPDGADGWLDLVPLDARYTLALGANHTVAVFDAQQKQLGPTVTTGVREQRLDYLPSTGLLITGDDHGRAVRAIDPVTRAFGPEQSIGAPIAFLVDPALADGAVVVAADPVGSKGFEVREYTLVGLASRDAKRTYRVEGEFRAIDRAGRLYMAIAGELPGDVAVFEHGKLGITIEGVAGQIMRPSPNGSMIAILDGTTLALVERDGKQRWIVPTFDARDLDWPDGALVAQFPSGFVRYDLATGSEVARKCGFGFGRYDTPRTSAQTEGVVCD